MNFVFLFIIYVRYVLGLYCVVFENYVMYLLFSYKDGLFISVEVSYLSVNFF